jgi:hypothetical protein
MQPFVAKPSQVKIATAMNEWRELGSKQDYRNGYKWVLAADELSVGFRPLVDIREWNNLGL